MPELGYGSHPYPIPHPSLLNLDAKGATKGGDQDNRQSHKPTRPTLSITSSQSSFLPVWMVTRIRCDGFNSLSHHALAPQHHPPDPLAPHHSLIPITSPLVSIFEEPIRVPGCVYGWWWGGGQRYPTPRITSSRTVTVIVFHPTPLSATAPVSHSTHHRRFKVRSVFLIQAGSTSCIGENAKWLPVCVCVCAHAVKSTVRCVMYYRASCTSVWVWVRVASHQHMYICISIHMYTQHMHMTRTYTYEHIHLRIDSTSFTMCFCLRYVDAFPYFTCIFTWIPLGPAGHGIWSMVIRVGRSVSNLTHEASFLWRTTSITAFMASVCSSGLSRHWWLGSGEHQWVVGGGGGGGCVCC